MLAGGSVLGREPLLAEVGIPRPLFDILAAAVKQYLYLSLTTAFPAQAFEYDVDLLTAYKDQITALPNITPNGLLLPKQETYIGYNLIHRYVAKIVQGMRLEKHIEAIHLPVNIRIVHGKPNPKVDSRPRASVKLHSDIWAGELTNAIMIFLPVFGDMDKVGIEFFEPPPVFQADFLRPLPDFDEGACLLAGARKYRCQLRPGKAYLIDPYVLHRTLKQQDALRLSLDFRFLARQSLASDVQIATEREKNYISLEEWCDVGKHRLLACDGPLAEYAGGSPGPADQGMARNAYAADFRILVL
jgi:hypothetical protein